MCAPQLLFSASYPHLCRYYARPHNHSHSLSDSNCFSHTLQKKPADVNGVVHFALPSLLGSMPTTTFLKNLARSKHSNYIATVVAIAKNLPIFAPFPNPRLTNAQLHASTETWVCLKIVTSSFRASSSSVSVGSELRRLRLPTSPMPGEIATSWASILYSWRLLAFQQSTRPPLHAAAFIIHQISVHR